MVINLQPRRYATENAKVLYMGSYLRDTAFLWFQLYVTANPQPSFMQDFKAFCHELQVTFGDPDEQATAERQLFALRQRGSASSYLADFRRFSTVLSWNDSSLSAQFYQGLNDNIKDELARTGRPHKLQELVEAAIRIDARMFERSIEKGDTRPSSTPTTYTPCTMVTPHQYSTPGPRDPQLSYANTLCGTQPYNTPPPPLTRAGKLAPDKYKRRQDNNLSLLWSCHVVRDCPRATPRSNDRQQSQVHVNNNVKHQRLQSTQLSEAKSFAESKDASKATCQSKNEWAPRIPVKTVYWGSTKQGSHTNQKQVKTGKDPVKPGLR
jgi:hypothetical protein